jgi:hypothetical protein
MGEPVNVRTYPVPHGAQRALLGSVATADQLDLAATVGNQWAHGVIKRENAKVLADVLGGDARLPQGITDGDDDDLVVTGLHRQGQVWTPNGWVPDEGIVAETVPLQADEVAFVARAFVEGCQAVIMRAYTPIAVIGAAPPVDAPAAPADVPDGAKVLAVVDEMDRNAVLDLVAVMPGPKVMRRHDGQWLEDPDWLRVLRSVKPPPVVQLDAAQVASVVPQVDEQTRGEPFTVDEDAEPIRAAALPFRRRADEVAIDYALLAASRAKSAGYDTAGVMPPALQRYWVAGPGAAKIRWGTPGAMTRCARNLAKYVPGRAYQTCNNLGKKLGGKGVAWDVG